MLLCGWFIFLPGRAEGEQNQQAAKIHFDKGETHYRLGRFEAARKEYTQAYEATPLPGFLFNIGQCHRQLGEYDRC